MRIINLGSLNVDKVYNVGQFVQPGETITAIDYNEFCGGKGLNQSVALARAGTKVYHLGCTGQGGQQLLALLNSAGVNTQFTHTLPAPCGHAIIQVNSQGQNCIIVFGGANQLVRENYIDECFANFTKDDILLMQNETSCIPYAMKKAKEIGIKIAFNPSPITPALLNYPLENVDYFILNEVEGKALANTQSNNPQEILGALANSYPNAAIALTLGKLGAYYKKATGKVLHHGIYNVPVVDTTAAGDTFCGYMLACVAKGLSEDEALHYASVASSIAVGQKGAAPSIPTWQQVVEFAL